MAVDVITSFLVHGFFFFLLLACFFSLSCFSFFILFQLYEPFVSALLLFLFFFCCLFPCVLRISTIRKGEKKQIECFCLLPSSWIAIQSFSFFFFYWIKCTFTEPFFFLLHFFFSFNWKPFSAFTAAFSTFYFVYAYICTFFFSSFVPARMLAHFFFFSFVVGFSGGQWAVFFFSIHSFSVYYYCLFFFIVVSFCCCALRVGKDARAHTLVSQLTFEHT